MKKAKKPPEMVIEGQKATLGWLLSNPEPGEILEDLPILRSLSEARLDGDGGAILQGFELLAPEDQERLRKIQEASDYLYNLALEKAVETMEQRDSGRAFVNTSPVIKNLIAREAGEIKLGINEETGETAIFTLLDGYLTPYENEVIACIAKFWLDKQVTKEGNIYHSLGQLYRAMRHGAGTQSPTKQQREALLETLNGLERKMTFKLNDYLKIWGGFETNGGRVPFLSFSEFFGKMRGQEDLLILHSNISVVSLLAKNLHMYERPNQELIGIKTTRYTLELKEPLQIGGKPVKKRSFATNEDRVKFCRKYGITRSQIADFGEISKPWAISENRIELRNTLQYFATNYIRARAAGKLHSNKLPYSIIFERCKVTHHEAIKRAKADIAIILDHFVKCGEMPELKAWSEYKNKNSREADGIQIFLQLPEEGAQ